MPISDVKSWCSVLCVAAIEGQGDIQCNGKAAVQNQSKGIQMKSWCNECTDNTTTETCRGLNSIKKHSWIFEIRQQLKLPQESDYSVSCRNWFLITWNQDASYKETPMEGRQPHGNLNPGPSHQPESFGTAVRLRTDAWQIWCVDPLLWPTFRNLGCTESSSVTPFAKEGMLHQLGFVALFHSHAVHTEHCSERCLSPIQEGQVM